MSEETAGEMPATEATEGVTPDNASQELLERLKAFEEKVEGKFAQVGKDLGRVRGKIKQTEPEQPKAEPAAPQGLTHEDLMAAVKLEQMKARLPEKASAALAERVANGASFQEVAGVAELMLDMLPEKGASVNQATAPKQGSAATAAPREPGRYPESMAQYLELVARAKTDKQAAKRVGELNNDPLFLPQNLQ